jgi:energy-converting hydrogenase Eha subunit H
MLFVKCCGVSEFLFVDIVFLEPYIECSFDFGVFCFIIQAGSCPIF